MKDNFFTPKNKNREITLVVNQAGVSFFIIDNPDSKFTLNATPPAIATKLIFKATEYDNDDNGKNSYSVKIGATKGEGDNKKTVEKILTVTVQNTVDETYPSLVDNKRNLSIFIFWRKKIILHVNRKRFFYSSNFDNKVFISTMGAITSSNGDNCTISDGFGGHEFVPLLTLDDCKTNAVGGKNKLTSLSIFIISTKDTNRGNCGMACGKINIGDLHIGRGYIVYYVGNPSDGTHSSDKDFVIKVRAVEEFYYVGNRNSDGFSGGFSGGSVCVRSTSSNLHRVGVIFSGFKVSGVK
jgi:hypothetical protein